jgi:hypothetical protein
MSINFDNLSVPNSEKKKTLITTLNLLNDPALINNEIEDINRKIYSKIESTHNNEDYINIIDNYIDKINEFLIIKINSLNEQSPKMISNKRVSFFDEIKENEENDTPRPSIIETSSFFLNNKNDIDGTPINHKLDNDNENEEKNHCLCSYIFDMFIYIISLKYLFRK